MARAAVNGQEHREVGTSPLWRPKVYLDTSVISAFFDDRAPDRQKLTQEFWNRRLPDFRGLISTAVLQEIEATPSDTRRREMHELVEPLEVLDPLEQAEELALDYQERGIFSLRSAVDGLHVAIAVTTGAGYLASWNFKHLVRVSTRREINLVNSLKGYNPIEIIAPPEL